MLHLLGISMVARGAAAGGLELRKNRIKARGHAGETQLFNYPVKLLLHKTGEAGGINNRVTATVTILMSKGIRANRIIVTRK